MKRISITLTGIEGNIEMFVDNCLTSEFKAAKYEIQPHKGETKKIVIKDDEANIQFIKKKAKMYGIQE
ncbi:hypothetical protein [Brevibacillus sp. NRS-1366]|uniref:hypothetical protein n=1 Tax=Brevibacillus sp. NRS-1366 TaxID=3233899 RepID=UPI003D1ABFBD